MKISYGTQAKPLNLGLFRLPRAYPCLKVSTMYWNMLLELDSINICLT